MEFALVNFQYGSWWEGFRVGMHWYWIGHTYMQPRPEVRGIRKAELALQHHTDERSLK